MKRYIILLICCLLIPWSAEAKDQTINLKFTPREKVKVKPKNVAAERIYFEEVDDTRSRPKEIGENKEDKGKPIKILTSKEDGAGQFTLSVLKNEFQEKGFKVESSPNEASKIVSTTLLKFWTLEVSTYNTEIQLRVEVREKKGEPFFQKTYAATGTNRGRSLSEVNYNECISDALARITDAIFSDLEFLRVLAEKPKPPKVEAKPIEPKPVEPKKIGAKPIEPKSPEEKRLEEIKAEIKRLEELKAEEQRARDKQEADRRAEEKRLEEKLARDKQEADRRAEEKRLEEIKEEVKKLEKLKVDEKRALEKQEEEKRAEEKRLEELKAEVQKLEELKALKEEILVEEKRAEEKRAEEKRLEAERRAKERRTAPVRAKPADPVFGPK
ncbi:MAG: hypothetical protein HY787_03360 [Deltaproteobacteria bacterium]|nr:hypothetical protein [Deltaproteobacteria bacterium]